MPGKIYIPLPALVLQLFVPFLSKMRYWGRFSVLVELVLAVLAGMGFARLYSHDRRKFNELLSNTGNSHRWMAQQGVAIAFVTMIFLEFAILPYYTGYSDVRPQPVDQWLAAQEGDFAIAEFPYFKEGGPGLTLYRTLFHGKRTCSGAGTFPPEGHRAARYLLDSFPSLEAISLLKTWGPKYILVGARSYGEQWDRVQRQIQDLSDLQWVAVFDGVPIYHDVGFWNIVPGYGFKEIVDQIHVYELVLNIDSE